MSETPFASNGAPQDGTPPPWLRARNSRRRIASVLGALERTPHDLIALAMRLGIGIVFWRAGQLKVDAAGHVTDTAMLLFRDVYRIPFLPPEWAAHITTVGEHVFAAMVILGLGARLGAAGMLSMVLVIQVFIFPGDWPHHLLWASVLLYILAKGPGHISLDALFARRFL